MSPVLTRIAGIAVRGGALARDATEFVRDAATQIHFDHSRRVSFTDRQAAAVGATVEEVAS